MPAQVLPDQRQWLELTRDREFPLSGVISVLLHVGVLALLLFGVFRFLFDGPKSPAVELEVVTIQEAEGAGNRGHSTELRQGTPTGTDVSGAVENFTPPTAKPPIPDVPVTAPDVQPKLPDDPNATPIRPENLPPLPKLSPLLKGLPSGNSSKGDGGPGKASGGIGKSDKGDGPGPAGTLKNKRMMRWTMLFSTRDAADYLWQMNRLGVILGVQMADESIYLIRDLAKRPAVAEKGAKMEERIFWMDDDPASVRALTEELQLKLRPWRVIAFFPESVEKKLLERELAYGQGFGRVKEEDIKETKFRVDFRNNEPRFTVVEQH